MLIVPSLTVLYINLANLSIVLGEQMELKLCVSVCMSVYISACVWVCVWLCVCLVSVQVIKVSSLLSFSLHICIFG